MPKMCSHCCSVIGELRGARLMGGGLWKTTDHSCCTLHAGVKTVMMRRKFVDDESRQIK
jgi:hypothetical protein